MTCRCTECSGLTPAGGRGRFAQAHASTPVPIDGSCLVSGCEAPPRAHYHCAECGRVCNSTAGHVVGTNSEGRPFVVCDDAERKAITRRWSGDHRPHHNRRTPLALLSAGQQKPGPTQGRNPI